MILVNIHKLYDRVCESPNSDYKMDFVTGDYFKQTVAAIGYMFDELTEETLETIRKLRITSRDKNITRNLVGNIDNVHVYVVNYKEIHAKVLIDFENTGNHYIYNFIPENEIWINCLNLDRCELYLLTCYEVFYRELLKDASLNDKEIRQFIDLIIKNLVVTGSEQTLQQKY